MDSETPKIHLPVWVVNQKAETFPMFADSLMAPEVDDEAFRLLAFIAFFGKADRDYLSHGFKITNAEMDQHIALFHEMGFITDK
jgi:hypothetical protein